MAKTKTRPFDAAEYLDTPQSVVAYLGDALADLPSEFIEALGVVARAEGMTKLAALTGHARPGLYRAFSQGGNPSFATVMEVLHSLDIELEPVIREKPPKQSAVAAE